MRAGLEVERRRDDEMGDFHDMKKRAYEILKDWILVLEEIMGLGLDFGGLV
jgi:hypothetical protein